MKQKWRKGRLPTIVMALYTGMIFYPPHTAFAGAATEVLESKAARADLKMQAEKAADEAAEKAEVLAAKANILRAQAEKKEVFAVEKKAAAELAEAKAAVTIAEDKLRELEKAVQAAQEVLIAANAAESEALATENEARYAKEEAQKTANWALAVANQATSSEADRKMEYADKLMDVADEKDKTLDTAIEDRENKSEQRKEAEVKLTDARTELNEASCDVLAAKRLLLDAQNNYSNAQNDIESAKQTETESWLFLERLTREQASVNDTKTCTLGTNYYSWKDQSGNSGYELIMPYRLSFSGAKVNFDFETAYIIAHNNSQSAKGSIATWSDTVLTASHTKERKGYIYNYSLAVNLPTGKSNLRGSEKYAVMNEDLVEKNQFGEGWNFTPGISVSRKVGLNIWIFGMTYAFRGKYDSNDNNVNTDIKPGNQWTQTLKWQHIQNKWQMAVELEHIDKGSTDQGGEKYYKDGNEININLTYNRQLTKGQSLTLYYRNHNQAEAVPYASELIGELGQRNLIGQYFGFVWSKEFRKHHILHITGNVMKKKGMCYDPLTDLYITEGNKYTFGIGYDIISSPNSKWSLDVQKLHLNTGNNKYNGYNCFVEYSHTF